MLAGGSVNIIFGLTVYFLLVTGSGNFISTTVDTTIENSAAQIAEIQPGDKIIAVNGKKVRLKSDIDKIVRQGKEITLQIERQSNILEINIIPQKDEETNYYMLGIMFKMAENDFSTNIYYGFWNTARFASSIMENLKELFTGNIGINQFTGPIGISEVVTQTENTMQYIYILAVVSLSLGVTNLLPFPPLDGGKVLILLIESIIRRPIKENINNAIQMTGFLAIMALAVVVTYNDVLRIF